VRDPAVPLLKHRGPMSKYDKGTRELVAQQYGCKPEDVDLLWSADGKILESITIKLNKPIEYITANVLYAKVDVPPKQTTKTVDVMDDPVEHTVKRKCPKCGLTFPSLDPCPGCYWSSIGPPENERYCPKCGSESVEPKTDTQANGKLVNKSPHMWDAVPVCIQCSNCGYTGPIKRGQVVAWEAFCEVGK